jgi:hypothetical protein
MEPKGFFLAASRSVPATGAADALYWLRYSSGLGAGTGSGLIQL